MIARPYYMDFLTRYKDVPLVKVLSGIRRSGKSTILTLWRERLMTLGVKPENIIVVNYAMENSLSAFDHRTMYDDLKKRLRGQKRYYLLLDEVQEVDGWERVINTLLEQENVDIYVTGSNSRMLSSEISTFLTGRYVNLSVYPLSFKEYRLFKGNVGDVRTDFDKYLRQGGFPLLALADYREEDVYQIVDGIYQSVVNGDIMRRHNIHNVDMFRRVVDYVLENVGKTFSANAIVKYVKSEGRTLSVETVYNYLEWLEKAFIIYRCKRYDLQGKVVLKTQEKFYLADAALKYCRFGYKPTFVAAMLENIVYFELLRRGYQVYVGKLASAEVDFVGVKNGENIYVQVCRYLPEDSEREFGNLLKLGDNFEKIVLTMDEMAGGNIRGIKIKSLTDWLLEE